MATQCFALIQGRRMRVTRVDACGSPVPGADSQVVSKGFVSVNLTAEVLDGTDIEQTNASGELCVSFKSADQLKYFNVEIEFCEVDPDLFGLVATGAVPVVDYDDNVVGFRLASGGEASYYALEVWSGVVGEPCPEGAEELLGYFLLPWVQTGVIGDQTIENGAITFTVTGNTQAGSAWGAGPYDVVAQDSSNTPGPLIDPIEGDEHYHMQLTTISAPEALCGAQELVVAE